MCCVYVCIRQQEREREGRHLVTYNKFVDGRVMPGPFGLDGPAYCVTYAHSFGSR
jgi:hypothetical protein